MASRRDRASGAGDGMSRRKALCGLATAGAAGPAPAAWAQGRAADSGPPLPSLTAALRGALDQNRQVFEVQGYERPNDGGAARWRLAQAQEAGPGRRLHAPSRRWFQLETDRPAPEMLGAAADWNGRSGRDNGPIIAELAAWAAGRPILLGPGRYLASPIAVDGPLNLVGQGIGRTVLVQADTTGLGSRGTIYVDSGRADRSVGPVVLRDFALDGRVETGGFEEFTHLVSLHGVSDVLVARLAFLGFRGDGLYLGSGVHGQEERHNRKVVIQDCRFDGRTRNNRNCISVLDVNGLAIRGCRFANSSRADMPGAIDFEPNPKSGFAVVRDIEISANRFDNVGGSVGVICFHFPPDVPAPEKVRIQNNTASNGGRAFLYVKVMKPQAPGGASMDFVVSGNTFASGPGGPFLIDGGRGVSFAGNQWTDLPAAAQVGVEFPVADLRVADRFLRVGSVRTPYALGVASVSGLDLRGAVFTDCGAAVVGGENVYFRAMANNAPATSERVDISAAVSNGSGGKAPAMSAVSPLHHRVS